jgi:hypothetical protein
MISRASIERFPGSARVPAVYKNSAIAPQAASSKGIRRESAGSEGLPEAVGPPALGDGKMFGISFAAGEACPSVEANRH